MPGFNDLFQTFVLNSLDHQLSHTSLRLLTIMSAEQPLCQCIFRHLKTTADKYFYLSIGLCCYHICESQVTIYFNSLIITSTYLWAFIGFVNNIYSHKWLLSVLSYFLSSTIQCIFLISYAYC